MALLHREVLLEVGSNSRMKSLGEKKFEFFFVEYLRSADQRDCFDCKHTTEDQTLASTKLAECHSSTAASLLSFPHHPSSSHAKTCSSTTTAEREGVGRPRVAEPSRKREVDGPLRFSMRCSFFSPPPPPMFCPTAHKRYGRGSNPAMKKNARKGAHTFFPLPYFSQRGISFDLPIDFWEPIFVHFNLELRFIYVWVSQTNFFIYSIDK